MRYLHQNVITGLRSRRSSLFHIIELAPPPLPTPTHTHTHTHTSQFQESKRRYGGVRYFRTRLSSKLRNAAHCLHHPPEAVLQSINLSQLPAPVYQPITAAGSSLSTYHSCRLQSINLSQLPAPIYPPITAAGSSLSTYHSCRLQPARPASQLSSSGNGQCERQLTGTWASLIQTSTRPKHPTPPPFTAHLFDPRPQPRVFYLPLVRLGQSRGCFISLWSD